MGGLTLCEEYMGSVVGRAGGGEVEGTKNWEWCAKLKKKIVLKQV